MLSLAGPRCIFVANPTCSRSSKSFLGNAPPYLSSLVTIATPTNSTRSSRYISLVIPKANTSFGRLSFQFSAANDWNELQKSLQLETLSPSLTLSISCQSSFPIAAAVHSPSVNSPSNQLSTSSPYIYTFFYYNLLFCTPVSPLGHSSSAHLSLQC